MERDRFYQQIVERLKSHLDGQEFEACACDLLRAVYPGLTPLRGGDDAGIDGAISDGLGEPFPLIVTTSDRAIDNLTRNLTQYASAGGKRRKAVFATSKSLSPRRYRNLIRRAEKLGFNLIGVHEQEWFARALYRNPDWCFDLLGLTGRPSALSTIPLTTRPLLDQSLVGREADLDWLGITPGDRLLIGQPGSGKTFLLYQFVNNGSGLFVVSDDMQEVASAIRSEQPVALVIDDAHVKVDLLIQLIQFRREIGAIYEIIASGWNAERDQLAAILQLGDTSIHQLELLTRDEIVQIVKDAGILGPDRLIREIVDQAEGRPGLAVTLAQMCMSSGTKAIFLGEAISRSIQTYFEPLLGDQIIALLAVFAVGGDAGMPKRAVGRELGINLANLWRTVTQLAAGGIVWDGGQDCLSVYPVALRSALVRDVFFSGSGRSLDILPFLEQAPALSDVVSTLIGARSCGATIDSGFLIEQLIRVNDDHLWAEFAWLGQNETNWVLEQFPDKVVFLAQPGLIFTPERVLPLLFGVAIGDARPLNSATDHPLRIIQDWIHVAKPGTGEALNRRMILLAETLKWLGNDGDQHVGLQALRFAFSPRYESTATDPGRGTTVTIRYGYLTLDEILELSTLWAKMVGFLISVKIGDLKLLFDIANDWIYPVKTIKTPPDDIYHAMRQFGATILQDLVLLADNRPAYLREARQIALVAGIPMQIPIDSVFETLFPLEDREDYRTAESIQKDNALALSFAWSKADPEEVATRLAFYEREAFDAQLSWPRWSEFVCRNIAEQTRDPLIWAQAFMGAKLSGDLILPFLFKAAKQSQPGWIDLVKSCLERPEHVASMIILVLTIPSPPHDLTLLVLDNVKDFPQLVETLCIRGEVPGETVKYLLRHNDPHVAVAAAHGEWYSDPRNAVREVVYDDWRKVVVEKTANEYWLEEVFVIDPQLAREWLETHLDESIYDDDLGETRIVIAAVQVLNIQSRRELLRHIGNNHRYTNLAKLLVGNDLGLYGELLESPDQVDIHLAPLAEYPNEPTWIDKAKLALDKGYSPEQIFFAIYSTGPNVIVYMGPESNIWGEWIKRFETLCQDSDHRIQTIGAIGKTYAERQKLRALKQERQEDIFGIDDTRRYRRRR